MMLYQLADEYRALDAILDDESGVSESEARAIEAVRSALDADLDGACADAIRYIRTHEGMASARKGEVARLSDLAKQSEARAARVRALLHDALVASARHKGVKTEVGDVAIVGNGGIQSVRLLVPDVAALPDSLRITTTTVTMDREAARAFATAHPANPFVALEPRGTHLRIR